MFRGPVGSSNADKAYKEVLKTQAQHTEQQVMRWLSDALLARYMHNVQSDVYDKDRKLKEDGKKNQDDLAYGVMKDALVEEIRKAISDARKDQQAKEEFAKFTMKQSTFVDPMDQSQRYILCVAQNTN